MRHDYKKPKKKFYFSTGFLIVIGLIIFILIGLSFWKNYQKKQAIDNEIQKIKQEIERYENRNEELKEMANYLESDQAIKDEAKLNLGFKEEGEKVVVIKNSNNLENKNIDQEKHLNNNTNNFINWFNYFFN